MWTEYEYDAVLDLYKKFKENFDEDEVRKIFSKADWFAIAEASSARNVSRVNRWYRIPKKRKLPSVGRFQFLIYDMTHDKKSNDQTERWKNHFKSIIKKLSFHPQESYLIQIGFSLLAHDPMKMAKNEPNQSVYVSFFYTIF